MVVQRCVCTEHCKILRTYSDVGFERFKGYDVKLRHFAWHFRTGLLKLFCSATSFRKKYFFATPLWVGEVWDLRAGFFLRAATHEVV